MDPTYKRYFKTVASIWTVCFVFLGLVYVFALLPQKPALTEIQGLLTAKQHEHAVTKKAASSVEKDRLAITVQQLQTELSSFAAEQDEAGNIILDISQAVSKMNISAFGRTTKSYHDIPNCYNIGEISFRMEFTCGFNQFAQIINYVERHKPFIFVDSFTIERSKRNNTSHEVKMSLNNLVLKPQKDE